MPQSEFRVVSSTDGRVKITFFLVNIVSSRVIVQPKSCRDDELSSSIHLRGSKLQHTMWEISKCGCHTSTILNFCSTGSTTITVRGNYQLRLRASLDFIYHQALAYGKSGAILLPFATNNLNYTARLYGVSNPEYVGEYLCRMEKYAVERNDRFPSIKFNLRQPERVCFQLFVPSMCINTQYQTWDSLEKSGRVILDTILKYADVNFKLNETCVHQELIKGDKLSNLEIKSFIHYFCVYYD